MHCYLYPSHTYSAFSLFFTIVWCIHAGPGVPSIDTPHAAFSTSNSVTLGGNSNSYRWRLNDKSDCAEFYQINYWSSNGGFQENTECHHMPGKVFSIPNNSKLLHQSGNVDVQIRAVNKAGVGQWSDRSIVSSNFIRRKTS